MARQMGDEPVTAGDRKFLRHCLVMFGLGSKAKDEKVKHVAEKTKGKVQASGNGEIWRKRLAMDGIWEQRHAETLGCFEKQQLQKKKHCQGNHPSYERPTKMLG